MPNAFLVPMSKMAAWWRKDWMERHTYFLPRYDDDGRMVNEGHALASLDAQFCTRARRQNRTRARPPIRSRGTHYGKGLRPFDRAA